MYMRTLGLAMLLAVSACDKLPMPGNPGGRSQAEVEFCKNEMWNYASLGKDRETSNTSGKWYPEEMVKSCTVTDITFEYADFMGHVPGSNMYYGKGSCTLKDGQVLEEICSYALCRDGQITDATNTEVACKRLKESNGP